MSQIVKYHTMNIQEFTRKMLPLSHKIFRLSLRLLNEEEDARDAVQEVYLRLWNRKETLGQYRSFEAVAMTSARNYCLDRLKSHSHKMTVHGYNTETMRAYQPHEIFEKKQLAGEIRKTIASCPKPRSASYTCAMWRATKSKTLPRYGNERKCGKDSLIEGPTESPRRNH